MEVRGCCGSVAGALGSLGPPLAGYHGIPSQCSLHLDGSGCFGHKIRHMSINIFAYETLGHAFSKATLFMLLSMDKHSYARIIKKDQWLFTSHHD